MSKYINADKIIKTIQELKDGTKEWDEGIQIGLNSAIHLIENYPSADVAEVKHGEWENKLPDGWQCSECFEIIPLRFMAMFCWGRNRMNFCPNCGADMRGEENG